jgi:hypothetical protein
LSLRGTSWAAVACRAAAPPRVSYRHCAAWLDGWLAAALLPPHLLCSRCHPRAQW